MNEGNDPFTAQEPPMPRFKVYDYDQDKLIPIRFSKQIVPGTFEYTLDYLIDNVIDMSVFDARFTNDRPVSPGQTYVIPVVRVPG